MKSLTWLRNRRGRRWPTGLPPGTSTRSRAAAPPNRRRPGRQAALCRLLTRTFRGAGCSGIQGGTWRCRSSVPGRRRGDSAGSSAPAGSRPRCSRCSHSMKSVGSQRDRRPHSHDRAPQHPAHGLSAAPPTDSYEEPPLNRSARRRRTRSSMKVTATRTTATAGITSVRAVPSRSPQSFTGSSCVSAQIMDPASSSP
jgi:hypothetical protein